MQMRLYVRTPYFDSMTFCNSQSAVLQARHFTTRLRERGLELRHALLSTQCHNIISLIDIVSLLIKNTSFTYNTRQLILKLRPERG